MDLTSVIGFLIALLSIFGGQALEGGELASISQLPAFIIVLGGTMGATLLQSPMNLFMLGVKMSRWVFRPPVLDSDALIEQIIYWGANSRKEGILGLERHISGIDDPFVRKGLQLLVDGMDPITIKRVMEVEIDTFEQHHRHAARVWDAAGGYAPTIGILGAVLGLIRVMENLTNPSQLGGGIAIAFTATVYGVGLANLVFLPVGNKLKTLIARQVVLREMLIDGLVGIANNENPRIIEDRLRGYIF